MTGVRLAVAAAASLFPAASLAVPAPIPVVSIDMLSFAYRPAPIVLQAGQPVILDFVNRAGSAHDFTAPAFFRSARVLSGRVERGMIVLRGHQRTRVTLVPAAGRYAVHCRRPFHKMMGMRANVVVR